VQFKFINRPDYLESISDMEEKVSEIASGFSDEEIWFLEYNNLYTIGTGDAISYSNINDIPVFKTNRGGKITYHGPGQRVIYFMLNLKRLFYPNQPDISKYVNLLEDLVIKTLDEFGIKGKKLDINHGVWVGNNKICAIGIRVKKWIAYHGLALNVKNDLKYYDLVEPCGLDKSKYGVTSIEKEIGEIEMEFVDQKLITNIKSLLASAI
jgi:lipoyl(octanoyl) transferase